MFKNRCFLFRIFSFPCFLPKIELILCHKTEKSFFCIEINWSNYFVLQIILIRISILNSNYSITSHKRQSKENNGDASPLLPIKSIFTVVFFSKFMNWYHLGGGKIEISTASKIGQEDNKLSLKEMRLCIEIWSEKETFICHIYILLYSFFT